MPASFKKGLFLHVISHDKKQWAAAIADLVKFPGLDFVEIWLEAVDLSRSEINWLRSKLADYEIIIHAPFINLTLIAAHRAINQASLAIYQQTIATAKQLHAKLITFHAGAYPLYLPEAEVRKTFVANFQQLIESAGHEVEIALENISMKKSTQISYPVMLRELRQIQKSIPDINFTLDVGHCVQNNDNYSKFLINNQQRIKNIHLHNALTRGQAHFGFAQPGDLDLPEFLKLLKQTNYSNRVSLEVLGKQAISESWQLLLKNI